MNNNKNSILFVNSIHAPTYQALRSYERESGHRLTPLVIVDKHLKASIHALNKQEHLYDNATIITADFTSPNSIRAALKPYLTSIWAFTSQYENSIPELKKLIPFLPHLQAPTETSLDWATDKRLMREAFNAYDPTLSPAFLEVKDATTATIAVIEQTMSYPIIVKPSGLERSLLVAVAHNRQELSALLAYTFSQIHKAYKRWLKRLEPKVLVEELMDGDMYSIDTYVAADGTCRHAPPIKVVTGRKAGFDDFFAYLQMSPCGLDDAENQAACQAAEAACHALGLRSITAHTELMRTKDGWKIIEVGPRIGGYRHELYSLSHGLNHIANDILNRAGELPIIPTKHMRYAAIFKTYASTEGLLDTIEGLDIVQKVPSYVAMKAPFTRGDALRFARNNGDAVLEVTLCHADEAQLQTDLRTIEEAVHIITMSKQSVSPVKTLQP